MRINNFFYLIKEGIRSIFTHGLMSFASVCVTVACLIIVGSFSILMYNVNIMVEDLNQTNEVLAYVDSELSDAEAKSVGTKINMLDNILEANWISRAEALKNFIDDHEEDNLFQSVDPQDLRHRFRVVLEDNSKMIETVALLEQVPGVVYVDAEYELAEGFTTISKVLNLISYGIIAILLAVSLLIISNTVKIAMYDRQNEIAIMKMVGATNGFIRFPFVVEGFLLGCTGAALAFGLQWWLYDAMIAKIAEVDALGLFTFVPFESLLEPMLITFSGAGLFVGILGSWTAIRKFLNK